MQNSQAKRWELATVVAYDIYNHSEMLTDMLVKLTTFFRQHVFFTESLLVAVAMVVGKALSLAWKMVAAHQGAAVIGEIEIVLTTTSLLAAIAIQGLPMAITIWTAKLNQDELTRTKLLLQALAVALLSGIAAMMAGTWVLAQFPYLLGINAIAPNHYIWTVPIIAMSEIIFAWFNGRKHYNWYAFGKYTGQPLLRLMGFCLLSLGLFSTTDIISLHLNAAVVIGFLIICFPVIRELSRGALQSWRTTTSDWKTHNTLFWWQSLALSGSLVLYVIYTASDVYWLAHFHTPTMVGVYSLSLALTSLLELVFMPVLNLLQTRLSQFRHDPSEAWRFTLKNSFLTATFGLLASLFVLIFKPWLVLLFGSGGTEIYFYHVFWLLTWRLIANVLVLPMRHYLDFFDHQRQTLVTMLICFGLKFLLSWWLVPFHGISGIIAANIVADGLHALLLLGMVWRYQTRNSL